ncbi:penicillin acylase family protein [Nonomuraea sp. NPDC050556]|uniref:penicillin acylase family protein n=1 Tax=Nonomuraea sp. NPDC050556 TaxID=3364369 RepID=UPI00378ABD6F
MTISLVLSLVAAVLTPLQPPVATLRYTAYGIPHITARTLEGATYGQGYAQARDNLCLMAETYLTARGERSRYFGADNPPTPGFGAGSPTNAASDRFVRDHPAPPYGPWPEVRQAARGFAAGYNAYLRRAKAPACKGARPITEQDIFRTAYYTAYLITGEQAVAAATGTGSNAIAVSGRKTRDGGGALLGAPHLGWAGQTRFWQSQLTVPGQLDVSGATLIGLPLVLIGHNADVAWSHTISTARPFVLAGKKIVSATDGNLRLLNTMYGFARSRSTADVLKTLRTTQASPGNTIAADRAGSTLYADIQGVPNFPDRCVTGPLTVDPACRPGTDKDSLMPGTVGPARLPVLTGADYVFNANDSHWLTNLDRPLTGFPKLTGDGATERSLRTRAGLLALTATGTLAPGDLWRLNQSSRSHAADLALDALLKKCACKELRAWDRTFETSSRGALLFSRYWQEAAKNWRVPFDPADPLNTPRDPAPDLRALARAEKWMKARGIPLDARLGDWQRTAGIPVPGGGLDDGLSVLETEWRDGHFEPVGGNTFMQEVSFGRGPCPTVRTLLTYGQAADPASPHHLDQTRLYAKGGWVQPSLCAGAPVVETVELR